MLILASGALALAIFAFFSVLIQNTEWIWFLTRAMGLLSYVFLFLSMVLGELRLLMKGKGDFWPFRYHHVVSVFSLFLILGHFIAAFADNYMWGKNLRFTQYLGLSFSDKWLTFLSLGVIAFYLLVLVGITFPRRGGYSIGYSKWRLVHYLSYIAFFIAYIHAVNLGTDIKTSPLHTILSPLIVFSFILVLGLFITRIINIFNLFSDLTEVAMAAVLFILLLSASASLATQVMHNMDAVFEMQNQLEYANATENTRMMLNQALYNETTALKSAILEVRHGQSN
jgi:predicted ferric reductase